MESNDIISKNKDFLNSGNNAGIKAKLKKLAEDGQNPEQVVIECCDSRVNFCIFTESSVGEIFSIDIVGSIIGNEDSAVGCAIEYAAGHFSNLRRIIVTGHYQCGGIAALSEMQGKDEGSYIGRHLSKALPAKQALDDALENKKPENYADLLSEANLILQKKNVEKIIEKLDTKNTIEVVPCMINHAKGELIFNKFPLLEEAGVLEKVREKLEN